MKKILIGLLTGYLLTSIFSIPAPPLAFWLLFGFACAFAGTLGLAWYRFNDDLREGDF